MMTDDEPPPTTPTIFARSTTWARSSRSGILHRDVALGDHVAKGSEIAVIRDPFDKRLGRIKAPVTGVVIGSTEHPLVNRGDAVVHIAATEETVELGTAG